MWHDLRQALRILRKHPAFAFTAAVVLAFGVGLNTAIFTIVYAMLFRQLPVAAPHELVSIYQIFPRQPDRPTVIHSPYYDFFKERNEAFTDITAHWSIPFTLRADGETDVVNAAWVLSNYFGVLGVKPIMGRALLPAEDDVANPERTAVISHALWTRRFRSDPGIVGKRISLALSDQVGMLFTVVGVMGSEFNGISDPWKPVHIWVTMTQGREQPERRWSGGAIARLKPGVSVEQAREIIATQGRQFYYLQPSARPEHEPRLVVYRTNDVRMPFDPSAALVPVRLAGAMTVVVAMVLLVAATNIAGILAARGVGRSGEIAVRRVLGAGPLRIARQLLAESLLLATAGGLLGFVLARWLLSAFRAFTPIQFTFDVTMDSSAVLFTTAICAAVGVIVGIIPARQATSLDVLPWLTGRAVQTKQTKRRLRHAITLPQVAFSLMLLLVAGVYVRALLRVELADLGYEPDNVLVAHPVLRTQSGERPAPRRERSPFAAQLEERYAARSRRFYWQLLDRLRAIPGASGVAITDSLPLREPPGRANWSALPQEGFQAGERHGLGTERSSVSPGYFRTMEARLVSGRDFDERDTTTTPKVAVVSASVAQQLWPGRDPAGRMLTMVNEWAATTEKSESYEVVGVVGDTRPVLHEAGGRPCVYFPLGQEWRPLSANVLVRGAGDSRSLIPAIKEAVGGADPFADVARIGTMAQKAGEILYPRRIAAAILAVSGMIALLLATIGVYGVVSYSVAQRTGEIGVRMALGAERRDIIRLVLREGGTVAALGSLAGLALGYAAIRITSSTYLALPQLDIATILITPLALTAVVLLACYLPARRAGCVEPMDVLRRE
jgi:predicted permease